MTPTKPVAIPTDAAARKDAPVFSGVLRYFPDALVAVAQLSKKGNDQHNPGKPLHWDRSKSGDEGDALVRHQLEAGTLDTDGQRHSAKVAWRALAQLQKEIEAEQAALTKRDESGPWMLAYGDGPVLLTGTLVEVELRTGERFIDEVQRVIWGDHLGSASVARWRFA